MANDTFLGCIFVIPLAIFTSLFGICNWHACYCTWDLKNMHIFYFQILMYLYVFGSHYSHSDLHPTAEYSNKYDLFLTKTAGFQLGHSIMENSVIMLAVSSCDNGSWYQWAVVAVFVPASPLEEPGSKASLIPEQKEPTFKGCRDECWPFFFFFYKLHTFFLSCTRSTLKMSGEKEKKSGRQ